MINVKKDYKFWTPDEDELLKSVIGTDSLPRLAAKFFPGKSWYSLKSRANKRLKIQSKFRARKYSHDKDFWKNPNVINSYWAGFIGADGNLSSSEFTFSLQLQKQDKHHLENFKNIVKYTGPIKEYISNNGRFYPKITINATQEWYKDLREIWSITPAKTYTLQPPKITDRNLIISYLLGFADGDGWITVRKNKHRRIRLGFVSASEQFLVWIKDNIEKYFPYTFQAAKIPNKGLIVKPTKSYYTLAIDGVRGVWTVHQLRKFAKENNIPCLARKWDQAGLQELIDRDSNKFQKLYENH